MQGVQDSLYNYDSMSLSVLRSNVKMYFTSLLPKTSASKKKADEYEGLIYKQAYLAGIAGVADEDAVKPNYASSFYNSFATISSIGLDAWLADMKASKTGWNSSVFSKYDDNERRTILNITRPLEVAEDGIFTCPKCKGNRTHHYSRQVRSADEPATVFITCANKNCQYRWKEG